ncbi:MAG: hypothetical protein P1U65_17970 [Minwuia sp.]|nr:hypothetical protein [Minwuia sp.]
MSYLFLAGFLLLAALVGGKAMLDADPRKLAQGIRIGGGVALGAVGLFLSIRGLFFIGAPIGLFGLGLAARGFGWQGFPGGLGSLGGGKRAPSPGSTSTVRSAHLEMTLDHDSGDMAGRVLKGEQAGAELTTLDRATLIGLWQTWSSIDPDAARLLESYLDRNLGDDWRPDDPAAGPEREAGNERTPPGSRSGPMTEAEALAILELERGATADQIRQAHRRLMKQAHPDQGGPTWYAAKLNEAKDFLLGS